MGIISGFIKTKRYRKLSNGSYQLQSEWASSDTIEMTDGTTLTEKMSSHKQNASTITSGTLGGDVAAPASTAYSSNQLRNIVMTDADPGAGVTTSYSNGSIICVYE